MGNRITAENVTEALGLTSSKALTVKVNGILNKIYGNSTPTPDVVIEAVRTILQMDPELSALSDIYIYGWGNVVKIEPKYSFWIKKLIEYKVVVTADAFVVREGEPFEVVVDGDKTAVKHTMNPFNTSAPIVGAYARFVLNNDNRDIVYGFASKKDIDGARKASEIKNKGKKNLAWENWTDEMAKKIPLKRGIKLLPVPDTLSTAIELENKINYPTEDENDVFEKKTNAQIAVEDLAMEAAANTKHSVIDILDYLGIPFELKKGYVKINKDKIEEETAKKLRLLEKPKYPDCYIGLATAEVDGFEIDKVEEIEIIPVED